MIYKGHEIIEECWVRTIFANDPLLGKSSFMVWNENTQEFILSSNGKHAKFATEAKAKEAVDKVTKNDD